MIRSINLIFWQYPALEYIVFFIVDFVRGHVDVEYSEWCQAGIIERFEKFKMAAKMAAKVRFILKMVCIYKLDGFFCIYFFYKNHSLLSTNYFFAFGIIEHFEKFKMAVKMATKMKFLLKMIYLFFM